MKLGNIQVLSYICKFTKANSTKPYLREKRQITEGKCDN